MPSVPAEVKPSSTAAGKDKKSPKKVDKKSAKKGAKKVAANPGKVGSKKDLKIGTIRFGRERRKIVTSILKPRVKKVEKKEDKRPLYITKPIGGEKNGGTRTILVKKPPSYYPTEDKRRRRQVNKTVKGSYLKKSLTPGTVCILVAGQHMGKRVVFLKQLKSGLCLVTGPFTINKCPMRRINQIYLIATGIKLDMGSDFQVPEYIDDKYFKRVNLNKKKPKKDETDIFSSEPVKYTPSLKKIADQKEIDAMVLKGVKKLEDRKQLLAYMSNKFSLSNHQYPHALKF